MVDVEHRPLRALEDDLLAVVEHVPHQLRGVGDVLLEAVAVGQVLLGHRVQVERGVLLERAQRQALGLHRRDDLLLQDLLVEQVLHADAQPRGLVRVARPDPPARGADLQAAELGLAGGVQQQVVGHDQVRVGRDAQPADVHAPGAQGVELLDQHLRVDHHAVADHAALARVEDPRRDQVELPLLAVPHDRVPGVVAALEAHDRVGLLGEQVGDLALALVAPLGADYHDSGHAECSLRTAGARPGCAPPSRGRGSPAQSDRDSAAARNSRRLSSPNSGIRSPQISTRRETVRAPSRSESSSGMRFVVATIARSAS